MDLLRTHWSNKDPGQLTDQLIDEVGSLQIRMDVEHDLLGPQERGLRQGRTADQTGD